MIIALALVLGVNANAKTNWISSCGKIGEDGRKTLEMWDCEHQQNLQRKKPTWPLSGGKWGYSLILYEN